MEVFASEENRGLHGEAVGVKERLLGEGGARKATRPLNKLINYLVF